MEYKENRPFACECCELRFTTKQFLQRHYMVHTEDRNFKCILCSNTYKYKKGLNRHYKKVHSQDYKMKISVKYPERARIPYETTGQSKPFLPKLPLSSAQESDVKPLPVFLDMSNLMITSPYPVS